MIILVDVAQSPLRMLDPYKPVDNLLPTSEETNLSVGTVHSIHLQKPLNCYNPYSPNQAISTMSLTN